MKARVLKSKLNNTEYTIGDYGSYIAIGSPMCHNLIQVDKANFKMTYALGNPWDKTQVPDSGELAYIWIVLSHMIESGELKQIIDGNDEIENPLPVFTVIDGELIETVTDKYGWPNTDREGRVMYDNTYFKTKREALEKSVVDQGYVFKHAKERVTDAKINLERALERSKQEHITLLNLRNMLHELNKQEGI